MTVGPVDRDAATAEFFDGAAVGKFLLRCCPAGHYSEPAVTQCTRCGSMQLRWVPASGGAALVSWSVVWSKPGQQESNPTVLAIAELDEGPWWWSQLADADPAQLAVGDRLVISFRAGGSEHVPVFELAARDDS